MSSQLEMGNRNLRFYGKPWRFYRTAIQISSVIPANPGSDILDAEPDIRAMNRMGYDAMAAGNHEFDNPSNVLKKQFGKFFCQNPTSFH